MQIILAIPVQIFIHVVFAIIVTMIIPATIIIASSSNISIPVFVPVIMLRVVLLLVMMISIMISGDDIVLCSSGIEQVTSLTRTTNPEIIHCGLLSKQTGERNNASL